MDRPAVAVAAAAAVGRRARSSSWVAESATFSCPRAKHRSDQSRKWIVDSTQRHEFLNSWNVFLFSSLSLYDNDDDTAACASHKESYPARAGREFFTALMS